MGLFSRFVRAIKAQFSSMVKKIEDPEKLLDQLILDMNKQLIEAKRSVAHALADQKRLEKKLQECRAEVKSWDERAVVALKAGREDLAKEALLKKAACEEELKVFEENYEKQHQSVEKLKASLRELQEKIDSARRKRNILIARAKRVQAQKKLQDTIKGMSDTSAFLAFEELERRVEEMESEAEVMEELDSESGNSSLESEIAKLQKPEDKANVLLEDLKKRLSLPENDSE